MATISLNELVLDKKTVRVKVGDVLTYAGKIHGSVGFGLDYEIKDAAIIGYQNFLTKYHNPENMKAGWTGGDGATGTYFFEAKKAGATVLRLIHLYRGDIEEEYFVEIIVE
jgi:hypothetical protein